MNPEISIIVPVYNVEKYIERCLQSISKQKYKDFEVIIINDGSTDGSKDILGFFGYSIVIGLIITVIGVIASKVIEHYE